MRVCMCLISTMKNHKPSKKKNRCIGNPWAGWIHTNAKWLSLLFVMNCTFNGKCLLVSSWNANALPISFAVVQIYTFAVSFRLKEKLDWHFWAVLLALFVFTSYIRWDSTNVWIQSKVNKHKTWKRQKMLHI